MMNQVQAYGLEDVHLLLTPRSTSAEATETWLSAARVAAVLAGAYALSSNRVSSSGAFGGQGWIIDPDGNVMGVTSERQPSVTLDVDIATTSSVQDRYFPRFAKARPGQVNQGHVNQGQVEQLRSRYSFISSAWRPSFERRRSQRSRV
jgi:predicted amidohydrolase